MGLLIVITFISAFLMFQIELVIAKLFLPHYGGSYLVWGACIVFFQAVLLAGYVFAHSFLKKLGAKKYINVHLGLLCIPLIFFPLRYLHLSFNNLSLPLVLDIFVRLALTIGPVFFVLSTMSMVTQSWLAASILKQRHNPYGLYAVSNLGSFGGLLSYPFYFERYLSNSEQLQIWRILYLVLVGFSFLAFAFIKVEKNENNPESSLQNQLPLSQILRWLVLGAAGVVLFLSVTNIITYEVAPVPLLWILPLAIYLLGFVLNFNKKPCCPSWINRYIGPLIGWAGLMYFLSQKHFLPVLLVIVILSIFLFLICMYTQHQLISTKPSSNSQLTLFYVMISLGGFLGGMLTSWIIPLISNTLIEYLVGLALVALTLPNVAKQASVWKIILALGLVMIAFWIWPLAVKSYHLWSFVLLWAMTWIAFAILASNKKIFTGVMVGIILITPFIEPIWQNAHFLIKKRNYYGIYEVYEKDATRVFVHGTTLHGLEFLNAQARLIPLGYYSPISPIGTLLINDVYQAKRIGVVGLGTGTLSMYSKPSCSIDYYELDPDVQMIASKYFWYLSSAPGIVNVILGDARLSLENAPDNSYDLLLIDAFSGDSIPTHLVNKDVLNLYRRKINSRGAIVFHITNRYLNLESVLAKIAYDAGAHVAYKDVGDQGINMRSIWCIITWDDDRFLKLITQQDWQPLDLDPSTLGRLWSDDYSSILPIINMSELQASIQSFNPWVW